MDSDLSPQDRKDLDKFIKFFVLKTVQVIVQARLGEKICTRSSSSPTGSDWFTLAIKDIPEVTHEAKKALAGQLPTVGRSMCVEISLKTSEGDSMELETWCLEINEKCEKDIKVSYTVYTRLSLLLKSLLSITRVTPAYKLSRKQGHDYVILYRQIERTRPIMGIIIDHFVERPLGNMAIMHPCNYRAPVEEQGGVYAGVEDSQEVCTTSFSTSPPSQCLCTVSQAHSKTSKPTLMATLKVSVMGLAFSQQLCTSRLSYQTPLLGPVDLCHPTACSAAAHPHQFQQIVVPGTEGGIPQVLVQPCHGTQADHGRVPSCPSADTPQSLPSNCSSGDINVLLRSSEGTSVSPADALETTFTRKVGAFVNRHTMQVTTASLDLPFAAFAPRGYGLEENDPMKPAFSKDDLLPMDLGTFYREFQNPPQLTSLSIDVSAQSMAEDLDSLPEKLAMYEKNIDEFDAFVDTLQ
ncbi:Autophagy-related protein 13 [Bagarius yarrelli]|uniref:Autophagy-related protein 13 n=1 Tax=Bagarius yarrelli TaxID=175774 RepID=A0A556V073_BAGYA|nr:Autophagy-related protein 13 [Bagarius yarrelli]